MNSKWTENLRSKMEAYDSPSPEGLWEDIEQTLIKELSSLTESPILPSPSPKRSIILWGKRIAAVAATIAALLLVGDYLTKELTPLIQTISQDTSENQLPENNELVSQEQNVSHSTGERGPKNNSPRKNYDRQNTMSLAASSSTVTTERIIENQSEEVENIETEEGTINAIKHRETENTPKQEEQRTTLKEQHQHKSITEPESKYERNIRRGKASKWQANLYASNTTSGASVGHNGYRSFSAQEITLGKEDMSPLLVKRPHEGVVGANKFSTVHTEAKHNHPITIGASVKYNLNEKWSLSSGVNYIILSSKLRSGSNDHYYTSEQTLHNIGIPLEVQYRLWRNNNLSIYTAGGGMVEKNISGKLATNYTINNQLQDTENEDVSIDQLQWSINASLGIEYRLYSNIAAYAEPGVIHYFENNSEVETIYKKKSTNFNLRVGLRFSLGK